MDCLTPPAVLVELEPKTRVYEGNPWDFVWSANGARRDLGEVQRALIKKKINLASAAWQAEHQARREAVQEEADRKRSAVAKERPRADNGTFEPVAVLSEPPLAEDHPTRAAEAAEAHVSSSTQAKADWLLSKRPDLAQFVRQVIRYAESWDALDRLVEQIQAHFEAGHLSQEQAEGLASLAADTARLLDEGLVHVPAAVFLEGA